MLIELYNKAGVLVHSQELPLTAEYLPKLIRRGDVHYLHRDGYVGVYNECAAPYVLPLGKMSRPNKGVS